MSVRPPILSARFLAVLRASFETAPGQTLRALGQLLRGKRLRAWNMLSVEAARSPHYYARWIVAAEPRALAQWASRSDAAVAPCPPLLAVVMRRPETSAEETAATVASLKAAFGPALRVELRTEGEGVTAAELGEDSDWLWLIAIAAGDRVHRGLGQAFRGLGDRLSRLRVCYWDEDRIAAGRRCDPWIKPDWDDLLFAAHGGLLGAAILHRSVLFPPGAPALPLDDRALLERIVRADPAGICHLPLILTHRGRPRPRAAVPSPVLAAPAPSVSIIIPMRDKPELLRTCLAGLDRLAYAGPVEIIIVDNGSTDPAALALLDQVGAAPSVTVLRDPGAFNFSRLNNLAVAHARGQMLCLLNNDIEPLDATWLTTMMAHAVRPEVGAVGALLLYPDRTVQHAGVAIGLGHAAGHVQRGVGLDCADHWHWAFATRRVSAVTGACLVVGRDKYLEVGGLDEEAFAVAFNDVDLCLKLDRAGYRNVYVAEACLVHHESKSRGLDDVPEKAARFARELRHLQERWDTIEGSDPYFSPVFSKASERCVLAL